MPKPSRTQLILDHLVSRPEVWVPALDLMHFGGLYAWRTRVSDARFRLEAGGLGTIVWNGEHERSAYRFMPRVGDADGYREFDRGLVVGAESA